MSGNSPIDPRARRTRDTLGDALLALMAERHFDSITVQEVLDRAGVSRSTFYSHYTDKQDLFLSDVEEFFQHVSTLLVRSKAPARRIAPVRELFTHVADVPELHAALVASGKAADVRELGVEYLARSIEDRLRNANTPLLPAEFRPTAVALAGALFSLLDNWLCSNRQGTPQQMDDLFHRLVPLARDLRTGQQLRSRRLHG